MILFECVCALVQGERNWKIATWLGQFQCDGSRVAAIGGVHPRPLVTIMVIKCKFATKTNKHLKF